MRYFGGERTLVYDSKLCTGCRRCTEVCPHRIFTMSDRKAVLGDARLCMECGACSLNCEAGAIESGSGVGCAAALIGSMLTGKPAECGCSDESSRSCC